MAEFGKEESSVYWSRDNSDEEQQMVFIPGLRTEGNLRTAPKFKSAKPEDRKSRTPASIPEAAVDLVPDWTNHRDQQGAQGDAGCRSASLKDLCPEDKRRIANLIKELARVSEEKEVTEERLKTEHKSFEKKIRHLEEQNELIATEREALQQQYRDCQELLSLYQKYLSEQQDKLNRSLSDLGAAGLHSHQAPKTQRKPTATELNGSYLALCHKQDSEQEISCSTAAGPLCRTDATCGFHRRPDRYLPDSCTWRERCGSVSADAHHPSVTRAHHCGSAPDRPPSRCCAHRAAPGRSPLEISLTRRPEDCSLSSPSAASALCNGVVARVKESVMSEQRKHELLLQKMELEVEKEQLQQLLEEHEAKLLEKQQELLQTKLETERNPPVTREMAVTTTPSLGAVLNSNGSLSSPVRPSPAGLPTPPSSRNCKNLRSPERAHSEERVPPQISTCKGPRRDASTSPSAPSPRMEMNDAKPSSGHRDLLRYETSLVDMLDAISPISAQRQNRHDADLYDLSIISPPTRRYSKPVAAVRREEPTEDPEERRILEEIFFIC